MNRFSELNIKVETTHFKGEKIKIARVLNREITVHKYKIEQSKVNTGQCLHMEITIGATSHVVFTGSNNLQEQIKQVPPDKFPFSTIIIQENETYTFT